jgi:hypothetical protein
MAETSEFIGGCLCGAVRFRAEGAPKDVGHCHCDMCRKATGAALSTYASFHAAQVTFTKGAPRMRRSSSFAQRGFCANCGSQLLYQGDATPEQTTLNVGCLDNPETVEPTAHIFVAEQISWLKMDDGLPRHEGWQP